MGGGFDIRLKQQLTLDQETLQAGGSIYCI